MANILIDSDVLIDFIRGIPSAVSYIQQLQADGDVICTCDVVIAEIESGLNVKQSEAARLLINEFVMLERDAEASRQAGRWRYDYALKGVELALADALIAATVHAHNAGVLTRNMSHYPMPELRILPGPSGQSRR